jgi:very-short-patch-repair endonuclease
MDATELGRRDSSPPPGSEPEGSAYEDERLLGKIGRAVKDWTAQLVDLTGNNRLLNFKETRTGGSIVFDGENINDVELGRLLGGFRVELSKLFFDGDATGRAARLARAARKTSITNYEERGLTTLFLAWGMATWDNRGRGMFAGNLDAGEGVDADGAGGTANGGDHKAPRRPWTPNAPVLLQELSLEPKGGAAEDFELQLNGEWEINPTLVQALGGYGVELDPDALLGLLGHNDEAPKGPDVFERLEKIAHEAGVPRFRMKPQVVLGNFSYAKLPMVRDLGLSTELLLASDLICAIAGDEQARQVIRERHPEVSYNEVDCTAPEDEFLICDTDSSQNLSIDAVLKGADLVIQGPPGTGKSQTIANLIATLAARGKRVLFVAEKRAAIDVVIERLGKAGLGELVLDLHGGAKSRVQILQQLSKSMADASAIPAVDTRAQQQRLVLRRDTLVQRNTALHMKREPWGLSVYEIQAELLGIPKTSHTEKRFDRQITEQLTEDAVAQSAEELRSYISTGGFEIVNRQSPWLGAFSSGTVATPERSQEVLDNLTSFASRTLPDTTARLQAAFKEVGLRAPSTVSEWAAALGLLERTSTVLGQFDSGIFEFDLAIALAVLAPLAKGGLGRSWHAATDKEYRKTFKAVKAFVRGDSMTPRQLHATLYEAAAILEAWRAVALDDGAPRVPVDLGGAAGVYRQFHSELRALDALLDGSEFETLRLDELTERLRALVDDQTTLFRLPQLHELRVSMNGRNLWPLIEEMRERNLSSEQAVQCLRYCWLASILSNVSIADNRVGAFNGEEHSRTVKDFIETDHEHQQATPHRIKRLVAERIVATREQFPNQSDLLKKQAALKRKVKPLRQLFTQAPELLTALRPCWAMSPLVVSQLLPAKKCFDVVIFDEASQVAPADAVGALMRAERAVVAGDSKQLPPTRFFASGESGNEDEEESDDDDEVDLSVTSDIESILKVMCAVLPAPKGQHTLRWHYRSKDERLIAFSNSQDLLYAWSLVTFPGVTDDQVITHHLVPFKPSGVKHKATLPEEVKNVVELVTAHAHDHPNLSLGVIALGSPHADAIEEALRLARRDDEVLNEFMDALVGPGRERFFVKNLERVQGDERDAIILTIGYGRSADGRMRYTFGPLNAEGGEYRLNVAVTRARRSMALVSSFSSQEMDPAALRSDGAKMLRDYLAFAESGGSDLGTHLRDSVPLNPFERDVLEHLTSRGIPLESQHGCSGYWIDFVARHPTLPGLFVLAIETDGARYHSSPTARDRDRLRQEHLERLGWKFHRIWSTDWFYRREEEIEEAYQAYEQAVKQIDAPPPRLAPTRRHDEPEEPAFRTPTATRKGAKPITPGLGNIKSYSDQQLVDLIRWIESDTLMRTEDELLDEAIRLLGFQRRGPKIVERLNLAVHRARNGIPVPSPPPKAARTTYRRRTTQVRRARRRYW